MKIIIDWYRHGLSCANVFHQRSVQGALAKILPFLYTLHDPDLTRLGWRQAVQTGVCLGAKRNEYDLVGSSVMSRAIETAMGIWSGSTVKQIHVLPDVGERRHMTGMDVQNIPQATLDKLKEKMEAWKKVHKVKDLKLDYSFLKASVLTKRPSTDNFYGQTLPCIVRALMKRGGKSKTIKIAIVSHGGFIRENLRLRSALALHPDMKKSGVCGSTHRHSRKSAKACCSGYKDPAWNDPETYSVPNTAGWREELKLCGKERRVDRLQVRPWYTPDPTFRIYRTGKKDPLFRSDLEGCEEKVINAVLK